MDFALPAGMPATFYPEATMKIGTPIGILCLVLLASWLSPQIEPRRYAGGLSKDERLKDQVNRSALGLMLGEFRTSLSDMFYLQTENFLHYGVRFLPHDDEEHSPTAEMAADLESGETEEPGHHDHDGHDHEGCDHEHHDHEVLTVIPTADKDFRSWLGEIHRQVKPWQAPGGPHLLADDSEVVPLFRMMTLADPHYVRGYQIGTYWIQRLDTEAAYEFIEEGLQKNPKSFELYLMRGFVRLKQAGDLNDPAQPVTEDPEKLQSVLKAKADFQQAAEFMMRDRPPQEILDTTESAEWSNYQESDARAAVNLSIILEQRYGDPQRAQKLLKTYMAAMPNYEHLKGFLP
jgi:hypothetical protein